MIIEEGWRFQSADFSVQASGKMEASGFVTLVRAPAEKARWHQMPEESKEDESGPPLYAIGRGMTLEDAVKAANIAAARARPIDPNAIAQGREPHSGEASPGATGSTTPGNHGEGA
jgi:hypothetical protein